MANLTDVRPIKDITYGGPVQQGHGIAFTVVFEGEGRENFYVRSDQLGMLIAKLLTFGSHAEQIRSGVPKDKMRVSTPFHVSRFSKTSHSPDGKQVSIEVVTEQGFPFDLAMSIDLAKDAIAKLQSVILGASKSQGQDRRN